MTDRYPAELNTVARVKIGVGGVVTSARRWLDLVAGTGVTITPVDDGVNEKVTVTVGVTGAPPTGTAGGDLTGTYPNPTIGAGKVVTASILDANVTTVKIADANVTAAKLASEAWVSWSPTVTSGTGTITTVGTVAAVYQKLNRTVAYRVSITITTNGTGANTVRFTLPVNSAGTLDTVGFGRSGTTGSMLQVFNNGLATAADIVTSVNVYPGSDGAVLHIAGVYESAS